MTAHDAGARLGRSASFARIAAAYVVALVVAAAWLAWGPDTALALARHARRRRAGDARRVRGQSAAPQLELLRRLLERGAAGGGAVLVVGRRPARRRDPLLGDDRGRAGVGGAADRQLGQVVPRPAPRGLALPVAARAGRAGSRPWSTSWRSTSSRRSRCSSALLPAYVVATTPRALGVLDVVAALVGLGAVALEATADLQMHRFVATKQPGQVMDRGLWAWSRHPNYVGELGFWVSLALFGLAASPGDWWWLFLGVGRDARDVPGRQHPDDGGAQPRPTPRLPGRHRPGAALRPAAAPTYVLSREPHRPRAARSSRHPRPRCSARWWTSTRGRCGCRRGA